MTTPTNIERLKALEATLRSTTQEMATTCSVPMELWDRHSNTVLEAADALPALLARIERVEGERDEAQMEIKRHFPSCAIVYGPLREAREALSAYRAELLKVPAHSLKKRQRNDDR